MNKIQIHPLKRPIQAEVMMPGSKSFTNRALVMASLAIGKSILKGVSESEDSVAMIEALRKLGIRIKGGKGDREIQGNGGKFREFHGTINVGDAGTTMRFLTSLCALVPGNIILDGSARMRERPIGELVGALKLLGVRIEYLSHDGYPPVKISGGMVHGGRVELSGAISSQYISALLLIAPLAQDGLIIDIKGKQVSLSYIDMTIDGLRDFGINVKNEKYEPLSTGLAAQADCRKYGSGSFLRRLHLSPASERSEGAPKGDWREYSRRLQNKRYRIAKGQTYRGCVYRVEGDASGASYLWAVAAITGSTIRVTNMNPRSSQGDIKFPDLLMRMGCRVIKNACERWIEVRGARVLEPITCDMTLMPDTAQTLAVVATFAKGKTTLTGLSTLQIKETKRLTALNKELRKMGITSQYGDDTITIKGGNPEGALIETYGDHRMAMAFAVAGTRIADVRIKNPNVVGKSFPKFWEMLKGLGIIVEEV